MLTDNTAQKRYEMQIEGQTVFATYRKEDNVLHIIHVEAPVALRGKGAANQFMTALMEHLREQNMRAFPICSYALAWLGRHKEYQNLLAVG